MKKISLLILLTSVITSQAIADLKPERLTVFNTGFAHHIYEGTVQFEDGTVQLPLPPAPLYGTYWLSAPRHLEARFAKDDFPARKRAKTFPEILQSLAGYEVMIRYTLPGGSIIDTLAGTIIESRTGDKYFRLMSDNGNEVTYFFDDLKVLSVTAPEHEGPYVISKDSSAFHLRLSTPDNVNELPISLHFLSAGRAWSPFYYFRLTGSNRAQMKMKGRVYNQHEEIEETRLVLAVGKPTLHFNERIEDFAPHDVVKSPRTQMYLPEMQMMRMDGEQQPEEALTIPDAIYRFDVGSKQIPAKGSMELQLFEEQISFTEDLHVSIPHLDIQRGGRITERDVQYPVYLVRTFRNTTAHPWPEGAVFIEDRDGNFVAQQKLDYTPRGSEQRLKLAEIPDIRVENYEQVTERESQAVVINERTYGKATMKGTLSIHNYTGENRKIQIEKIARGEILRQSHNGESALISPLSINPANKLTWEVEVGTNGPLEVTYTYEALYRE